MPHTKPLPHQPTLPFSRLDRRERRRSLRQPETTTNVLHNDLRDLSKPREVPEALETSQRQHERQEVLIRPCPYPCPRHLVLGRAHQSEILGRSPTAETAGTPSARSTPPDPTPVQVRGTERDRCSSPSSRSLFAS